VGDVAGSPRLLSEEETKRPATGIKQALLQFFRFVGVDERATFLVDPLVQNFLGSLPSYLEKAFQVDTRPPSAHSLSTRF